MQDQPTSEPRICTVDKCASKHYAVGLCRNHYAAQANDKRKNMWKPPCTIEGCGKPHFTRESGLCRMHWNRLRKFGGTDKSCIPKPRSGGGRPPAPVPEDEKHLNRKQRYYIHNTEKIKAYSHKYALDNPEKIKAAQKASRGKVSQEQREKKKAAMRAAGLERKKKAIGTLGGKCVKCGYSENIHALQIDHINGDGWVMRAMKTEPSGGYELYSFIIKNGGMGKYQCLCANCNQIKRMENEEHPSRCREERLKALAAQAVNNT